MSAAVRIGNVRLKRKGGLCEILHQPSAEQHDEACEALTNAAGAMRSDMRGYVLVQFGRDAASYSISMHTGFVRGLNTANAGMVVGDIVRDAQIPAAAWD